ncbi:discoidin domain-containing protein [Streptomyces sp. NPDC020681]|uniref:discoidin domain-containing protein n=1 Tax=Streptomyces sp. NPDC020681 TaxID=3365083 RepID=UPI003794A3C9
MSLSRKPYLAPLVASALIAAAVPSLSYAKTPPASVKASPKASPAASCERDTDPAWAPTSTRIDASGDNHAYSGNGYLGIRVPPTGAGYAQSTAKTGWPLFTPRYDGAFVAGLYAHHPDTTADRQVLAALPTWTTLDVRVGDETFGPTSRVSHYRQTVFQRCGLVRTSLTWTTADGRATDLVFEVVTDRSDPHTGAVRLRVAPHWDGSPEVTDRLDWRGARRITRTGDATFRTEGTVTDGAIATTLRRGRDGDAREYVKYVGVDTTLTSPDPRQTARDAARRAAGRGWHALLHANTEAWSALWTSDVLTPGEPQLQTWLRSAQYGLLANTRRGSSDSLAPTGLTSDNYAGLVFWDAETWMYPGLLATRPELARSVLDYRYRTREGAAENAAKLGFKGLFYPWTSGGEGGLWSECQSWNPPHCITQIHLQGDISLSVWQYYLATGDRAWLRERGWPLLKGIADFWVSRVTENQDGSYSVTDVAGPDEYSNGVDDAVFTNAGAATALRNAARAAELLGESAPPKWRRTADGLRIPYDAQRKIFLQYAGYPGTRIKQADTVLLTYPLQWPMEPGAAAATLDHYAQRTDPDGPAMTDSVHAIDAAVIGAPGCSTYTYLQRAIKPFVRGPFSIFAEARGDKPGADDPLAGSPAQDFITGKGGFLQVFTHGLTGLRLREDGVRLDPLLPPQLRHGVTLRGLRWQGRTFDIAVGPRRTTVRLTAGEPFTLSTPAGRVRLEDTVTLPTRRPDLAPTDNAARCVGVTASSEEPGMYAAAAVDGSTATAWIPDGTNGTLTADLGRTTKLASVAPRWTDVRPVSYTVETSADAAHWAPFTPGVRARHIRLTVRSKDADNPAGVRELTVRRTD